MRKPRRLVTKYGLELEIWKDSSQYEYIVWRNTKTFPLALLRLREAKRLRAMCDYVVKKSEEPSP